MGRPTKLTPELQADLVRFLRGGVYVTDACALVGIDQGTYHRWVAKAAEDDAPEEFREFREAVEKARAEAVARNVALVQKAADHSWQAAAWWLERSRPDQYGRRTNLAGASGGAIEVKSDDEERQDRLRALVEQALEDARNR